MDCRRIFLWLLLGSACTLPVAVRAEMAKVPGGSSVTFSESMVTPLGLDVRVVGVHDQLPSLPGETKEERYSRISRNLIFHHGNLTVRFVVTNPTPSPQPLTFEIPLTLHTGFFESDRRASYVAKRMIPPGKGQVIDLSVPHIGRMQNFLWASGWKIVDGSGKKASDYRMASCEQRMFDMPLHDCQSENVVVRDIDYPLAVSRSFKGEFKCKDAGGACRCTYRINYPDFSRFNDWRDLACYGGLVFTKVDWQSCTPAFRELVKDYQAAGGKLVFAETAGEIDADKLYNDMRDASRALCGYDRDSAYSSDRDGIGRADELKHSMPFGVIVLVLLAFSVLAGPVLICRLARRGRRLHLIWMFPVIAIVFSVAVALAIVLTNGLEVKTVTFCSEVERPDLGRKVIVRNTIYVAPFPMTEPIVCSPTALLTVDSGDSTTCGDVIESTPEAVRLVDNWTPCLWPIRVRELEVVRTAKEATK